MIGKNLSIKQKQTHRLRDQSGGIAEGEAGEREIDWGIWGQQMQTITFGVDE